MQAGGDLLVGEGGATTRATVSVLSNTPSRLLSYSSALPTPCRRRRTVVTPSRPITCSPRRDVTGAQDVLRILVRR